MSFIKRIVLIGGSIFTWIISRIKLTDTHIGIRAFDRFALSKIRVTLNDFTYASEILDEMKIHNLKYVEVPVNIKYTDYSISKGQSVLNAFKIAFKMLIKKLLD